VAIDAAFIDGKTGAAVLVLVQPDPWDEDGRRLDELQVRVNECATFALDGQMTRQFPETAGKSVAVSIEFVHEPGAKERRFFDAVSNQLAQWQIELRLGALN
jgi:hypothetical protein